MRPWVKLNREAFERDVLRDFCLASDILRPQFARLESGAGISFPAFSNLVGEPSDKGLLWRLKDKAHQVFLKAEQPPTVALLLDWTLGYIFHESLKLMEDAHQSQYYAPRLDALDAEKLGGELADMTRALRLIQSQTQESIEREARRLQALLVHSRRLFCLYFADRADHRPLARFLYDNSDSVRRTFEGDHEWLLLAVYGQTPERMYLEAARSLLESARFMQAAEALAAALEMNPRCAEALELLGEHGLLGREQFR